LRPAAARGILQPLNRSSGRGLMKRKIAAIFAADIAGYSRLVAEDEEETLRRLAAYRAVTDDFIAKGGGRIFNTAGDAVLAEFPSAVEAVRCAIDIQESLRTRNMAYPPSRQMSFRIGITIGDVVERDGDLLGDGVNIAARLEGLAEVGGICISRAVHEQVANKLSVQFADIGAQEVKNIPTPVHAYMVAMRREDGTYAKPQVKKPAAKATATSAWMWPLAATVVCVVAICAGAFLYWTRMEMATPARQAPPVPAILTPSPAASAAAASPDPAMASPQPRLSGEKLAADTVPFIADRARLSLVNDYAPAPGYKAFALNINGITGSAAGQPSEEAAKTAALEQCSKRAEAVRSPRKCEVYAVGSTVVYPHGLPPMPPAPWVKHDVSTERPFTAKDMPLVRDQGRERLDKNYMSARKSKSIALGPGGQLIFYSTIDSVEEANRRTLEACGAIAGVPCMIVVSDDVFVVPVPASMKAIGFFHAANDASIASDAREEVARKLAEASGGWNAVAVGTSRRPGLALKALSEQAAINDALGNCAKRDGDCRVIAIGPFAVAPN
jgi:class 3 adenylate cyclase